MLRTRLRSFTLIELLVVISIIAVLIALLLPAMGRAKEQGRRAVCGSHARSLITGVHVYASDNSDEVPARSAYFPITLNYFRPGPGGPTVSLYGDFSAIYPNYVSSPDAHYCPSGPYSPDTPWWHPEAMSGYPAFYGYFPWHNIWGRYITYDYFGRQTIDYGGKSPPLDINGDVFAPPVSLVDEPGSVLITDMSNYDPLEDAYTFINHPPNPDYNIYSQRDGTNVGYLDGSVVWKHERETVSRFQWRPNLWKKF